MTASETKIAKRILDFLHEQDGRQVHALTIHGEIGGLLTCPSAAFDEVMGKLDASKYIIGVQTKFKGILWNISDAGEAARLQM